LAIVAGNGHKNGKTEKDILLTLLGDVRELQTNQQAIQKAQESIEKAHDATNKALAASVETTARMIGSVEALIEAAGRQDARIDDLDDRLSKLEGGK
jgi:hypothetical protein